MAGEGSARKAHRQRCPYCDRPFNSGDRWKRHVEREVCKKSEQERRAEAINWVWDVMGPVTPSPRHQLIELLVLITLVVGLFLVMAHV